MAAPKALAQAFSTSAWTGDSTVVESASTVLWAYSLGASPDATINGVTFTGIAGGSPAVSGRFSLDVSGVYNNDTNNLTSLGGSGSAVLAANFVYGNPTASLTLQGLTVGQRYSLNVYTVGWDPAGQRQSQWISGSDSAALDVDEFGDNNGVRINHVFVADATTRTIQINAFSGNTWHFYGLALSTTAPTVTAISPSSGTTAGGTNVTITGTNFSGATGVTIGGAAATGVTVVSATSITCTTPAGAAGTASVLVTTPYGTNAANTLYTYVDPPDYTVTTTGNTIVVTDMSGNGETLTLSEPSAGNIKFAATGRTFGVNGGANITGDSGTLSLSGVTSITVNAGAGSDSISIPAFSGTSFPSLTINGGTGTDTATFSGAITFAADKSLVVDITGAVSLSSSSSDLATSGAGVFTLTTGQGVTVASGASLTTASGDITINANQQTTPTAGNFTGFANSGTLTTTAGKIVINARAGTLSGQGMNNNGTIQSVSGNIEVVAATGAGSNSTTFGLENFGGTVRTTGGGNIVITGTSYATGSDEQGIRIGSGTVSTTGASAGSITLNGTGSAAGAEFNHGVNVAYGSTVTTTNGTITINGVGGGGSSNGLRLQGGTATVGGASTTGNIIVNADRVDTFASGEVTQFRTTGSVTFRPLTAGTTVSLAGSSTLDLSDAELDGVTAGSLVIGSATSGAISIGGDISPANYKTLVLANNVTWSAGTFSSDVGPSSSVFEKMSVTGTVTLSGGTMSFASTGGFTPAGGDTFAVLTNDGGDAISGTFSGLAEGATISNFLGSSLAATISYVGGDGNDVVLTAVVLAPTVTSVTPMTGTTAGGTPVTITGTKFTGATGVTFGGVAATSVTVVNDTTITAVTPAGAAGAASVVVTTASGSNGANSLYTFANTAPTLGAISKSGTEDTTVTFTAADFTGSYSDVENTALASIKVTALPATGTLKLSTSNVTTNQVITAANLPNLNYVPAANENGAKTFTVTASDGTASSSPATTVTITLAAVNDAPTLDGPAGGTWAARDSSRSWIAAAASSDGTKLVACTRFGGFLYTSTDSGTTWTARESSRDWIYVASSANGTKLVAVDQGYPSGGSLYTSTDSGVTWTARSGAGTRVWSMVASSADGTKLVAAPQNGQLMTSTDSGVTWTARESSRLWFAVASSSDGTKLAAAVQSGGLYTSTDSGVTWTLRSGAGTRDFKSIASSADGTKLVAAANGAQLLTSTDSGVTWTSRESSRSWRGVASSSDGSTLLACPTGGLLYLSTDSGVTWTARESSRSWNAVAMSANAAVMVGTPSSANIYVSTAVLLPLTIAEDAGAQTVNLTGISSGAANESQTLAVTATSSNTAIIPHPTVTYTSANTTGSLSFTPVADANGVVTITATVTDDATAGGAALATSQTFTVTVTQGNDTPTDITLSSTTLAENNVANATVGTFSTTDVDAGDTFTYTLVSGAGSTDNGSFTISGNELKLTPSANFELKSSYDIRVRSTDAGALFIEKPFTITISNVLETPVIASPTSTNLTATTATLGGNVTSDGGAPVTERGVVYAVTATNSNPQIGGAGVTKAAGTGTTGVFTVDVSGLSASTAYSYAAYVTNGDATSYTSVGTFTTTAAFVPGTGVTITYSAVIGGTTPVSVDGGGTLILTGPNTYDANTNVQTGTISINTVGTGTSAQSLGTGNTVNLGVANTSSGSLVYTGGAGTLDKNINSLGNGGDTLQNSGSGLLTLSGTLNKTGTTLTLQGGANGITVSGTITGDTGSPDSDLVVDGGTTTLTGANTYNGPTHIINGGTLNANAVDALPTSPARSAILMDQSGTGSSTLSLGVGQSVLSLTGAGTSAINLNANTLTLGATSGSTTFAGIISGTGGLTKDGASTQVLSGANTYNGTTTVSGGTLTLQNSNASTTYSIAGGATLEINNASGLDLPGASFSGTGTLKKTGSGQLFWGLGVGTFALGSGSMIDVQAGTLTAGSYGNENWSSNLSNLNVASGASFEGVEADIRVNALTGSGTITSGYPGSGSITFGVDNGSGTFSGVLANGVGVGTFIKAGTGTQILSGTNTYTGATTISGGTLQIGAGSTTGSLSTSSSITNNATLAFNRSNTVTQGTDFASVISGSGAVTQAGTGTTILNGTNTYTGTTTVSAGVLNIRSSAALGTVGGSTSVSGGAALQIQGDIVVGAEALTLNGTGVSNDGALRTVAGTNTYGGLVTLGSATRINTDASSTLYLTNTGTITGSGFGLTVGGAGNTTIQSIIGTGTGTLTKDGAGDLYLTRANTYTGTTTISGGRLVLGTGGTTGSLSTSSAIVNDATLAFWRSDTLTQGTDFASVISGSGAVSQAGTGTTILNGANTYTGATTVSTGVLSIRSASALGTTAAGTTVNAGAALQIQGVITTANEALTLNGTGVSNDGALRNMTGSNTYAGLVTLGNATRINSDSFTLTLSNTGTITGAGFGLTVGGAGSTRIDSIIGTGSGTLTKDGAGTLTLTGANTYTGTTTISGGTLQVGAGGTTGSLSTSSSITNNATLAFNRSNTVTQGTDFASVIGGSGAVTQAGAGTLVLNGANTYAGATTVSTGVLNIRNGSALGTVDAGTSVTSGAALQIQGGITTLAEALTLNGTGVSANGALRNIADSNTYAGLVTLGSATRINSDAGTLTLSNTGTITGAGLALTVGGSGNTTISSIIGTTSGTLTKDGTGTLTLAGANTYTGTTTVSAGILNIQNATGLGTTAGGTSVSNGATLQLQGGITVGAEALSLNGGAASGQSGALVNVSGTNTYGGAITVTASSSISAASGSVLNLTGGVVKNGTTATFNGGGTINVGTVGISGSSASSDLVIDGTTVNLNVANTYNGPTFIRNSGTLNANVTNALPTANGRTEVTFDGTGTSVLTLGAAQSVASLTSAGAATVTLGAHTLTIGAASGSTTFAGSIGGAGGLIKDGASTVTLSGSNGYTGATLLSAGSLVVNGSIASSSLTTIDGGTLLGTGTVGAIQLNSGGAINAGGTSSAGTLNTGSIAIVDGQLQFNLGGTSSHDQISTNGTINLAAGGAGAKLVLNAISGYTATLNDSFTLVSNDLTDAISGAFAKGTFGGTKVVTLSGVDYVEGVLGSSYYGRITYDGGTGNDLVLKVVTPEITITESASNVADGGTYDFGQVDKVIPSVPLTKTFTIKNDGEVDLTGIVVHAATGAAAADYVVNSAGTAAALAPGASTTFTVTFDPSRIGTRAAAIVIDSNDLDENPFNIALTGVGSIARDSSLVWVESYGGPDAPTTRRNGQAKAVAVQKSTTRDEALAVFATGHTTNAAGNKDIYTARYHPETGALIWAKTFNGTAGSDDEGWAIALDASGNVVITGYTSNGGINWDVYVAKYANADGALLWSKTYAGAGGSTDAGTSVAVDGSGNVAVAGYGVNAAAGMDFFAARYAAADGSTIFERLIEGGSNRTDAAHAVAVDSAGNVAVAGNARNASNNKDFRVLHLAAATGATNWQWTVNGTTNGDDDAWSVAFNAAGQVIATGSVRNTNDDLYTVKLDSAGGLLWQQQWNSSHDAADAGYRVALDSQGHVVVAGISYQSTGYADGYVARYDGTSGAQLWNCRFNGAAGAHDVMYTLDLDAADNVVATGASQNANGSYDIETAKMLSADGAVLWDKRFDGASGLLDDYGLAVAVAPDGNVFVAGYSTKPGSPQNTTDFLVLNYNPLLPAAQTAQTIAFANPGAQSASTPLNLSASASSGLTVSFSVVSGPAELDSAVTGRLNFTGNGPVTVRASQSGSAVYAAATPVDQTFTVNRGAQTIAFTLPADLSQTAQWPLTGVASSGLAVTYSVESGPGSITGGVLSFSGAGAVTVRASQAGDARYNAAADVDAVVNAVNHAPIVILDNIAENWRDLYAGSGAGEGNDLALQISGNDAVASFVAGYTTTATDKDVYLAKYNDSGTLLWSATSGTSGHDEAMSVVVDDNGDVVIAGYTTGGNGQDVYVAKHSGATGARIWSYSYNGAGNLNDVGLSLALEGLTNVVVGGYAVGAGTSNDFFAAKLNLTTGAVVWTSMQNRATTFSDVPARVVVGTDGSAVLAGISGSDAWTVKLAAADGTRVWQQIYNYANKPDAVRGLALDGANNVIIAAYSQAANYDMYTAKYSAQDGTLIWGQRYNSSFNSSDAPWDMTVDEDANVYVTGTSYRSASVRDGMTLKYAGLNGTLLWEGRYNGVSSANDENLTIALDGIGNPVISGYTANSDGTTDVYLAKHNKGAGDLRWERAFDAANNKSDVIKKVRVDPNGNVWMTGSATTSGGQKQVLVLRHIPAF